MKKEIRLSGRKIGIVLMLLGTLPLAAQEGKLEGSVSSDLVSQYLWRGQDLGSVSVQPSLGVSYKGFSLSAWGNIGISDPDDTEELDLTLGYENGGFSISVTDYWLSEGGDPKGRYFKYDAHSTNHVWEGKIGYDFGLFAIEWNTNFAGNDGLNKKGKRAYSSYFELSVPFKAGGLEWTGKAGAVPYATDYYGTNGFAVTNLSLRGSKELRLSNTFSIPLFGEFICNPCSQKAYLVFGFTLHT